MEKRTTESAESFTGKVKYSWNRLSDFDPDVVTLISRQVQSIRVPATSQEILIGDGTVYQLRAVDLAFDAAMGRMRENPTFTTVLLIADSLVGSSARIAVPIAKQSFALSQPGGDAMMYALLRIQGATDRQYLEGRNAYLKEVNKILVSIGLNEIPPVAF